MNHADSKSAPLLWTRSQRRLLGRLFDAAPSDHEEAFALTRRLAAALGRAIPSSHAGIDLIPILEHKLAGYNADLFAHAVRLGRARSAAEALLARGCPRRVVFPFRDPYLAEYCIAQHLHASGGMFLARDECVRTWGALRSRYRPRSSLPGFEPLEIGLDAPPPAREEAAPAPAGPRVLLVASMNNYLNPMVPVARKLADLGHPPLALLPAGSGSRPAGAGLPSSVHRLTLPGPQTTAATRAHAAQRDRYSALWVRCAPDVARCFRVGPIDLWPLVAPDVERFVKDYFPYAIACIELAFDLATRLGITSVAVARLRRATESALAAGFRARGIPVTMLVHGHVSNFPERRFDAGSFAGADRVCVWGAEQARQVMQSPWPARPDAVVAAGNPAWDSLVNDPARDRPALRRRLAAHLSLDPALLWAVLTTQTLALDQFPAIAGAFARQPRAALIVKVHPAEDPAWYRLRLSGLPTARVLPHAEVDLHDLLCAADLTLTFSSTTNLESLLLGTPVVTYTFGALAAQDRAVYLERFQLPLARRPEDLEQILHQAAQNPESFRRALEPCMRRAVERTVANHRDGAAASHVAHLLLDPQAATTLPAA